jgi:hypothetical protein
MVVGLTFVGMSGYRLWHRDALATHGHTAIIQSISAYEWSRARGMMTYTADFHWKLQGSGQPVRYRSAFPRAVLDDLRAHREVRIYYDPADYGDFIFEKDEPGWQMFAAGTVVVLLALVCL